MYLIPMPKVIIENGESFSVNSEFEIALSGNADFAEFEAAKQIKMELEKGLPIRVVIRKADICGDFALWIKKTDNDTEDYRLEITSKQVRLSGGGKGIFYGTQTLCQIIRQCGGNLPGMVIEDSPRFKNRGFFHDVTRGKVPTLNTLYELADRASFYKINQLQLYVEHSFAFKNFSEVWTGKDPVSAEKIIEFDEYCRKRHIELVPALATFGHLYEVLSSKSFSKYCELENSENTPYNFYDRMAHHSLNVSDEKSFTFVKSMLDEYMPLFSSQKFNIGCDETFDIGKGRSAQLAAKSGTDRIYVDFLKKLIAYLQAKGKTVQFYGDIILKSPEFLNEIPNGVDCLYWNYGSDVPVKEIETLSNSGASFYVCPGVCGWNMMMNLFDTSFDNITKMVDAGCKYGANGVLNTDWGDYGHINLFANSMPGMAYGAGASWNPDDKKTNDDFLKSYVILEYGAAAAPLAKLLHELSNLQTGNWSEIVCWHDIKITDNQFAQNDKQRIINMDEQTALKSYHRALEIENEIVQIGLVGEKSQDIKEFVCAARGVAIFNAACLAIKKCAYLSGTILAKDSNNLASDIESWFYGFTLLWRARNEESELYRIREVVQSLCRFLRECN